MDELWGLLAAAAARASPEIDHTNSLLVEAAEAVALAVRYAHYLFYWYESANTDAEGGARRAGGGAAEAEEEGREERRRREEEEEEKGVTGLLLQVNPKFTCFTSTKVQILTLTRLPGGHRGVLSGRRRRKYGGGYSGCSQHS